MVDFAMMSAYRPPSAPHSRAGFLVLAGDTHCHIRPPDAAWHVDRGLHETLTLAKQEHLDFVILTPHVRARFFQNTNERDAAIEGQRDLARGNG
jgi:hypothetical protein